MPGKFPCLRAAWSLVGGAARYGVACVAPRPITLSHSPHHSLMLNREADAPYAVQSNSTRSE